MEYEVELFDGYSIEEIKQGFYEDKKGYTCLICGKRFEKGQIYSFSNKLYEGKKAIGLHIKSKHNSVKEVLLKTKANNMGISELQLQLLNFFADGLSDKEIAERLGVSSSTIRNHRYKLRERERQNKMFISLMELLMEDKVIGKISTPNEKDKAEAEEEGVSDKERKRILDKYMTETGRLKAYPNYERNKKVILEAIMVNFYVGKKYTEGEINQILESIFIDFKRLKNELIAYGYIDRTDIGGIYWVKDYDRVDYPEVVAK